MNKREILLLQETERKRISEELHDTTVQNMICLSQKLELVLSYMDQDLTLAKLEVVSARKQVKSMINEMRDAIYDLRPLIMDDMGWIAAFERLKDKLSCDSRNICFDIDLVDTSDGVTAISIYRIICEGCQNIIKHSDADHIEVSVKNISDLIRVCIRDNGIGIELGKENDVNHFGLRYMREKVDALSGRMKICSEFPGTMIEIDIPARRGL